MVAGWMYAGPYIILLFRTSLLHKSSWIVTLSLTAFRAPFLASHDALLRNCLPLLLINPFLLRFRF